MLGKLQDILLLKKTDKDINGIKPFWNLAFWAILVTVLLVTVCIFQFHTLQYITLVLVLHISLSAANIKLLSFLNVNLLYLKCVLSFISILHDFDVEYWIKWNEMLFNFMARD